MAASTKTMNLWQRIHAVMKDVSYIQKEKKAGMKYSIVSHDAVTKLVREHFINHGVVYYPTDCAMRQDGNRTECKVTVRFVNIDKPEENFDVVCPGYGVDPQDKGPGKAMSYAVKYAVLKTLSLETGDDPDNFQGNDANYRPADRDPETGDTQAPAAPQSGQRSTSSPF